MEVRKMDGQKFIDTINGMKSGEYYTHNGNDGISYMFHKYNVTYEVWVRVNGYNIADIHFDRMDKAGSIIGLMLGSEYVGCLSKNMLGVE